ncbi:hypothetical protein BSL78_19533 [Apostichopus japonicus]|uniref:Uncharacterized protein n=1 Tax=Stichopus japonicus TaxID=307972 RepID=A0A2G8K6M2_STIJA|nr:hypothetical protein BSL78_19533 [Apostichopus japonicus]
MKRGRALCCTDNLLLLPISGAFVIVLGVLIVVLYLVTRSLTTSLHYVEGAIPNYVSAIVPVCLVQVVTTAVISLPFIEGLSVCIWRPTDQQCLCYKLTSQNKTIVTDGSNAQYFFDGATSCYSVEHTLKDFLYIFCVVYGFAIFACLFTTLLTILLWCRYQIPENEERKLTEERPSDVEEVVAGSNEVENVTDPENQETSRGQREGISGQPRVEEVTRSSHTNRNNGPWRAATVQRSSSINAASQPSSGPRVTRHHSVATADTSPPDNTRPRREGNHQGRQRMPPILIRGGYLQGQLDGPTIPVYTLQGSNEAYISLTDLPSLQMPSLDSVPAFIPELPEPLPDEEPPPYSPQLGSFTGGFREDVGPSDPRGEERSDPQAVNNDEVITVVTSQSAEEGTPNAGAMETEDTVRQVQQLAESPPRSGGASATVETVHTDDSSRTRNEPVRGSAEEGETHNALNNNRRIKSNQRKSSREQNAANVVGAGSRRDTSVADQNKELGGTSSVQPKLRHTERGENVTDGSLKQKPAKKQEQGQEAARPENIKNEDRTVANPRAGPLKKGSKKMGAGKPMEKEVRPRNTQRRRIPAVPEEDRKATGEKKKRIKEQVLSSDKNIRGGRNKCHASAGGDAASRNPSPKRKTTKNKLHLASEVSDSEPEITGDRKLSPNKHGSGARPKTKTERMPQNERKSDRTMKSDKVLTGSSHESLSEMISLLQSVRSSEGKPDIKTKKRQGRSPLNDINFPDTKL